MVDGVLASCYASFNHDLSHIAMTPIQWIPKIMQLVYGADDKDLAYVSITKELGKLILPYGQI